MQKDTHTQKEMSPADSCQGSRGDLGSFAGLCMSLLTKSVPGVKGIDPGTECASCSPDRLVDWLFNSDGRQHRQTDI